MKGFFTFCFATIFLAFSSLAQHDDQGHSDTQDNSGEMHAAGDAHTGPCGIVEDHDPEEYPMSETAFHHISDQNIFTIGPWHFPLPCILYSPGEGFTVFSSSKFEVHGHHGHGTKAYKGYVLDMGIVKRIKGAGIQDETAEVSGFKYQEENVDGKEQEVAYACVDGQLHELEESSKADGGLFGGGLSSFYDFSITKNVLTMIITTILLAWMFLAIARSYRRREGNAPKGIQSFIEPIYIFIRDDVAKSMIGEKKYERYLPFLMALFFFILVLNLVGMVPFFGNANVTGNIAVTLVLAVFAFLVTNINGNSHYWQHVFWMPGIPWLVKLIMAPIEILGVFLKPFTLLVRLFANITAGHIVVLSFVGLIFIFGEMGRNAGGAYGGAVVSILLTTFMSALELLVAFIQAFIFSILTASYIGAAVAEEHH